jgi:hypothetical protein
MHTILRKIQFCSALALQSQGEQGRRFGQADSVEIIRKIVVEEEVV